MIWEAESREESLGEDLRAGEPPTKHLAGVGKWERVKKSLYKKQKELEKGKTIINRKSAH